MAEKREMGRLQASRVEYKKIQWPSPSEAVQYTIVTLIITLAVALFCWALDIVFGWLIGMIL